MYLMLFMEGIKLTPFVQYLDATLADEFQLRWTMKVKLVLGVDNVLLLLTYLQAQDTFIFLTKDQRLTLATIMLLSIYTSCRPSELANALKRVGRKAASRKHLSVEAQDAVNDMDVDESVDEAEGSNEPDY